jgi:hypothetical protein
MAGLEALGPGTLRLPLEKAGRLASGDAQRVGDLFRAKAEKLRAAAGCAEHAAGPGGMEALVIRLAQERLAEADGDLGAVYESRQKLFAGLLILLGKGKKSGKHNNGGVLGPLAVVVVHVEAVAHRRVGQGRHLSGGLIVEADHRAYGSPSQVHDGFNDPLAALHVLGGQDIADDIQDELFGVVDHILRDILILKLGADLRDLLGQCQFCHP